MESAMYTLRLVNLLLLAVSLASAASPPLSFPVGGHTNYGDWSGAVQVSPAAWKPGDTVTVNATLKVSDRHMQNLAAAGIKPDSFILLATAERTFDAAGHLHLPNDQYMSTLITPAGLPIEGGAQGAVTTRFGGPYRTPLDQFVKAPIATEGLMPGDKRVLLHASGQLPADLPPGIYRLRLDVGVAR